MAAAWRIRLSAAEIGGYRRRGADNQHGWRQRKKI